MELTTFRRESHGMDDFWTRESWNGRLLDARVVEWKTFGRESRGIYDFGRESPEIDNLWAQESCPIIAIDFPLGVQSCERIPKTRVSRFFPFYPLISAFQALSFRS